MASPAWHPPASRPAISLIVTLLSVHLAVMLAFTLVTAIYRTLLVGQRPTLSRRSLGWLVREWLSASFIVGSRSIYFWTEAPHRSQSAAPRDPTVLPSGPAACPPVLLVPGYSLSRNGFLVLAYALRRRGFPWVWAVNNRPLSAPAPLLAATLARRVEQLCAATGAPKVDIVAHSMGGLLAAYYVRHLGGQDRVRRIVTLGTPWKGSAGAVFAIGRQALDLMPGSEFLASLDRLPPGVTSIWSPHDTIVMPPDSALHRDARMVEVPWTGHHALLLSGTVLREVVAALSGPEEPPSPQGDSGAGQPGGTSA